MSVLSSNVLWNQHRKHHNVQSETRKLSQGANENLDKKKEIAWSAEKGEWLSAIFNRPLLSLTHFPVPSTVNEEFLKKNVVSRNISPVKRKVEYSLNTLWVLRMMSCAGRVTCLVLGSCCHGNTNSYARSLSKRAKITYDGQGLPFDWAENR